MDGVQLGIDRESKKGYPQLCYIKPLDNARHKYEALITIGYRTYKTVRFGGIRADGRPYEQYHDKLGHYTAYDHLSERRKELYYKRHKKSYPKYSADWFSKEYLW